MPDSARLTRWTKDDTRMLQILASVVAGQNREEIAIALLEYALAREPDNVEVKQALSGAYLLLDRHAEALDMAEGALAAGAAGAAGKGLLLVRSQALWGLARPDEARAAMAHYLSERQKP